LAASRPRGFDERLSAMTNAEPKDCAEMTDIQDTQSTSSTAFRQPRDALQPSAFTIEVAEQWALDRAAPLSADAFRLTSFWFVDFVRQAVSGERKTHYTMRLAQSEDYGIAFGPIVARPISDQDFLGKDTREILRNRLYRDDIDRVALMDLVMGHVTPTAIRQVIIDKSVRDKQALRSRLFADEAQSVLRRKGSGAIKGASARVLVIGATVGIISALVSCGFDVAATDMAEEVVNQQFAGIVIRSNAANAELLEKADLAIITGMTLPNRTLPTLMAMAKNYNTSTMIWAITGRNFGHYYTRHGVDCVIVDPSPFLLLPGSAKIGIWHREH
jgi:hypothetical protein